VSASGPSRLFQCPGCWSYCLYPGTAGSVECGCGERMTLIDLRERMDSLTDDEPRRSRYGMSWVVLAEAAREVQEIVGPFDGEAEAHAYAKETSIPGVWACKPKLMRASWLDLAPPTPAAEGTKEP
jgi:hypothetical protein